MQSVEFVGAIHILPEGVRATAPPSVKTLLRYIPNRSKPP